MNCNDCTNNNALRNVKIKHVYGNVLRMAIPLTARTLEYVENEIVATDTDFIPSSAYPVTIEFIEGKRKVAFDAQMQDGNVAVLVDDGTIPVGVYAITVLCQDDRGRHYRFKQRSVIQVVDVTADAGIVAPIEYEVKTWYLDAALFLALRGEDGEDGVGIDDIVTNSSAESGGINTVAIYLTDGRVKTFTIMNGAGSVDPDFDTESLHPVANKAITERFNAVDQSIAALFGDVDYDSTSRNIRFWDKDKTRVLAYLDASPFIKDETVSNVYISNGQLVVSFNTSRTPLTLPLSGIFNPNNYYTRTQVDSRIASAVANINLSNYYTKSQVDTMVSRITPFEVTFTTGNNSNIVCDHTIANIYQNYTNHKPIIAKYGESVGTLVYIKGGENPEAAFLFGDRYDSPYLLRNGVSGWGKEELGADIEVEPWPSIESDKPVASDGVAAALAQKVSSVTINGTTKTPDEDGDVSFTVEGGSGGYEPPVGGIPKTDLASDVQASLGKADTALQSSDLEGYATTDDVDDAVAALVSSAPQTLDTLKELADALGDDPNFATTMATQLGNKVDKETGKGLSTNDYTTAEKTKLAGLENYDDSALQTAIDGKVDKESGKSLMTDAERTKLQGIAEGAEVNVQPNWTQTNTSADDYIKNKPTLATVATSGSYNDLSNKPTIPTKVSDLTNDAGYTTNTGTVTGISVNGGTAQQPTNGVVNLTVATGGDNDIVGISDGTASDGAVAFSKRNGDTVTLDFNHSHPQYALANSLSTVATSGDYDDLTGKPTKVSDFTNDSGFTSNAGTITGITMNGASKGTSGVVNLGTVITAHQDISGKANKSEMAVSTSGDQTTITLMTGTSATVINQHQSLSGYAKYVLLADEAAYTALATKDSGTLYLIPES